MLKLNLNNTAAFDVDAQYTFTPECPNELPVAGGTEIVNGLNVSEFNKKIYSDNL